MTTKKAAKKKAAKKSATPKPAGVKNNATAEGRQAWEYGSAIPCAANV
jgi:hypothetical protein